MRIAFDACAGKLPGEIASLSQAAGDCDGLFFKAVLGSISGVWGIKRRFGAQNRRNLDLAPSLAGLDDVLLPHINPRDERDEDHDHQN